MATAPGAIQRKGKKMKYEKCIDILKERFKYTKTYKYTDEEIKEAQDMVIKLLENQIKPSPSKTQPKHSNWIPIKWHEITEEEREREGYPEEWDIIYDSRLPEDGTDTLIQTKWGIDIAPFCEDESGAYWEQYETPGEVIAWQPLPESYEEGSRKE